MLKIEVIKHFKSILKSDRFILTGSTVLAMNGLCKENTDIDIILINPSEETLEKLKKLQEESFKDNLGRFTNYQGEEVIMLKFEGFKLDFFVKTGEYPKFFEFRGIECNSIGNIIEAKKKIGRPKDWMQLLALSKKFSNPNDFNKYLENSI